MNLINAPAVQVLEVVDRGKPTEEKGPKWRSLLSRLGTHEGSLQHEEVTGHGDDPASVILRELDESDPAKWDYDLYLLADEHVDAEMAGAGFSPGRLRGRLYVWSYAAGEIVCAADASGKSSSSVGTTTWGGVENIAQTVSVLRLDLWVETLRSGLAKLFRAGPPKGG